jgi:uncharacterized protein
MSAQFQQIIFKIAERCNLNCSYCYYFNANDESYRTKPAIVPAATITGLVAYLRRVFDSDPTTRVRLIFHGGEPLMIGARRFDALCTRLRAHFPPGRLDFCIQTNAVLVTEAWIEPFERHQIDIGTSLDGPAALNDVFRTDHRNRGSYAATRRGIDLLLRASQAGRLKPISCLVVMQPEVSGRAVYRHLVDEVGFRQLDFLFPDVTHATFTGDAKAYGRYLIEVFDAWLTDDDPTIDIRMLKSVLAVLLGGRSELAGFGADQPNAFTIRADGEVELDDVMRASGLAQIQTGLNIAELAADGVARLPALIQMNAQFSQLPEACRPCPFATSCRGGQIAHRFHPETGLANSSVFCVALFDLFGHAAARLIGNGVPLENLPGLTRPSMAEPAALCGVAGSA